MGQRGWRHVAMMIGLTALFSGAGPAMGEAIRPHDAAPRASDGGDRSYEAGQADSGAVMPSADAGRTEKPPMDLVPDRVRQTAEETAPVAQPRPEKPKRAARRPEDITLSVATWDSAYTAAQRRALFAPFNQETGHKLDIASHGGNLKQLTGEGVAEQGWDLIEVDAQTARRGCAEGWLAEIDPADLPASVEGDPATRDYLPGALMSCGVGSAAWSAVVVHDPRADFDDAPRRITDFFALERFPGKRALPRQATYVLELALLADGVAPNEVYDVLATPAGQDRAFARLSAVRHAIVWWEDAARALDAFAAGGPEDINDVVMGLAFNGRVFTSAVRERQWIRILRDSQIYRFNYWAMPTSRADKQAVKRLLRFVSLPERQAQLTRWFPYGPVRKSALPLVGQHAEVDLDMADFVPTMPRNMTGALRFDQAFWVEHGKALNARFAEWLKVPAPRVPADQFVPPTPVKALRANISTVQ